MRGDIFGDEYPEEICTPERLVVFAARHITYVSHVTPYEVDGIQFASYYDFSSPVYARPIPGTTLWRYWSWTVSYDWKNPEKRDPDLERFAIEVTRATDAPQHHYTIDLNSPVVRNDSNNILYGDYEPELALLNAINNHAVTVHQ